MADNSFLRVTIPDQQFPPANAPAWTVSANAASDSVGIELTPSGTEVSKPSAPDLSDLPPAYFDASIVPNNGVLHYNQVVPYTEPSKAVVKRKKKGVLTLDPSLDANPDQVWLYFMTYLNERPSLEMNIHCYHVVHSTNGKTQAATDLNFSLDLTDYVCQQWWRVAVVPSKEATKKGNLVSLRDVIEQYTRSTKSLKEIFCSKQLQGWNFEALRGQIISLVRSTGYKANIVVKFTEQNNRIEARSSSKISRFSSSRFVRFLCVISCLWLIFGPIYLCMKAAHPAKDQIVAD